jgi:mxaA protein
MQACVKNRQRDAPPGATRRAPRRLGGAAVAAAFALGAAGPSTAADEAAALRVEASEPRAYGYQVGDVVARRITVHAPPGWRLLEDSLPRPGGRGAPIELRSVAAQVHAAGAGQRHELQLEYQVFFAPASVRTLEIAPLRLRFESATRSEELRVEGAPVTVAPLAPVEVSPRRGLGELQPDRAPALVATAALQTRLVLSAALALAALGALALLRFGPPWHAARNRPFARAWRELRRLPLHPGPEQWRDACRTLHRALNASAGEVLFEPGLERFVSRNPKLRDERDAIARFMQLSREVFFAGPAAPAPGASPGAPVLRADAASNAAWLVDLCRRCRDAERGRVALR